MFSFSEQRRLLLDEDIICRADIIIALVLIRDRLSSLSEFSRGNNSNSNNQISIAPYASYRGVFYRLCVPILIILFIFLLFCTVCRMSY